MNDRQQALRGVLESISTERDVVGAALVSRDGIPVLDYFKRPLHKETFSAMSATLLGAAEVALAEVNAGPPLRIVAEAADLKMVIVGVKPDLILVVLAESTMPIERMLPRITSGADGIAKLVAR